MPVVRRIRHDDVQGIPDTSNKRSFIEQVPQSSATIPTVDTDTPGIKKPKAEHGTPFKYGPTPREKKQHRIEGPFADFSSPSQIQGKGKNTMKKKEAKVVIQTSEPVLPYLDISSDPYFIKS